MLFVLTWSLVHFQQKSEKQFALYISEKKLYFIFGGLIFQQARAYTIVIYLSFVIHWSYLHFYDLSYSINEIKV